MKPITKSMENRKRTITVIENYFIYYTPKDGITEIFTYNETLLQILMHNNIRLMRSDGRLRMIVSLNGRDICFYGYDLAYAAYQGYLNEETYLTEMEQFGKYKDDNKLEIDHADDNPHNNTILNLSLMPGKLNHRKNCIVAKMNDKSGINSIYCDGKYRVRMEYIPEKEKLLKFFPKNLEIVKLQGVFVANILCETANEYVDCLKWLSKTKFCGTFMCADKNGKLPQKRPTSYIFNEAWRSINTQNLLQALPEECFGKFLNIFSEGAVLEENESE